MIYTASILSPLYVAFSWIMRNLYDIFNNYGLVIIIFTVAIRLIMIPFSVKQHKTTLKTQALAPQLDDLKRVYGKDRQGLQEATMALYRKHNVSQFGGCLPSLLPLIIIWPVYRMVSSPLQYISGAVTENITKLAQHLNQSGLITASELKNLAYSDIPVLTVLHTHATEFANAVEQGWLKASQLIDPYFLGVNLGDTATINPKLLFGDQMSRYLPILIIVLLAAVSTFLMSKMMEWTNPSYKKIKESKARAKNNPARSEVTDMTQQGMMKGMKFTMPLITLYMCFSMPAAMSIYWIVGNLMAMLQQYILYALYTKKTKKQAE